MPRAKEIFPCATGSSVLDEKNIWTYSISEDKN